MLFFECLNKLFVFFHPSTDFITVVMIIGKGRVNIRQRDALVMYKDFFRREPVGFMP